jgi:hypothetical protein
VKGIDWEMIRSFKPDYVKKTHDREYHPEEIIKIEDKLDVRGKVVMETPEQLGESLRMTRHTSS